MKISKSKPSTAQSSKSPKGSKEIEPVQAQTAEKTVPQKPTESEKVSSLFPPAPEASQPKGLFAPLRKSWAAWRARRREARLKPKALKPPRFRLGSARSTIFQGLALLIANGIDIMIALDSLYAEARSGSAKKLILFIKSEIASGVPLWKALSEARALPDHLLAIVRIGEETGQLTQNIQLVLEQLEKEGEFTSRIRSAMIYPAFVLVVISIVGTGITIFVLPELTKLYSSLNVELPGITKAILSFGEFIQRSGNIAIPGFFAVLISTIYFLFINKYTRSIGQRILFRFTVTHNLIQQTELSRFGYVLGNLLNTGIPISEALNSLKNSTTFYHYRKFYIYLHESILDGYSFQKSLRDYRGINRLIPPSSQQMIAVSESGGNLAEILLKIGDIYEKRNEQTTKDLPVILEPILIVVVWVGVAGLALAVLLPIYSLVGNLTSLSDPTSVNAEP